MEVGKRDHWDIMIETDVGFHYYAKKTPMKVDLTKGDWPKIHGKPGENVITWIRSVSFLSESRGESPEITFTRILSLLKDEALIWAHSLGAGIRAEPELFLMKLQKEFGLGDEQSIDFLF